MAQMVEHLPKMCKALSSNPSTIKMEEYFANNDQFLKTLGHSRIRKQKNYFSSLIIKKEKRHLS
jgi:hypothetical protein